MFCVCLLCAVICGGFLTLPAADVPVTACCKGVQLFWYALFWYALFWYALLWYAQF